MGRGHDDVIKWKHCFALLAFCAGNSPVTSEFPSQSQWCGACFDIFFICAWINNWLNNCESGDLRRHRAHYDINVMPWKFVLHEYVHNDIKSLQMDLSCIIICPYNLPHMLHLSKVRAMICHTKAEKSSWRNFCQWLQRNLSKWQRSMANITMTS